MALVLGIDPGLHGALATYDTETRTLVDVRDMPTWAMLVGKKERPRIDAVELAEWAEMYSVWGVDLAVLEAVGGRPKQSASAGFVFGYSVGLVYMALMFARIPVETVPPQTWKKMMRVPGKARAARGEERSAEQKRADVKAADAAIIARADELFPASRDAWRGARGGVKLDRAEAAILARFGGDYVLHTETTDVDWRLAYRKADTGA